MKETVDETVHMARFTDSLMSPARPISAGLTHWTCR